MNRNRHRTGDRRDQRQRRRQRQRQRNRIPVIVPEPQQELRFNPVPSLMQKGGTRDDPIKLEDDDSEAEKKARGSHWDIADHGTPANSKVKRCKITHLRSADDHIKAELHSVKLKMRSITELVLAAQEQMRLTFDRFGTRFVRVPGASGMGYLEDLAAAMGQAYVAAKGGITAIEDAVKWLADTEQEIS